MVELEEGVVGKLFPQKGFLLGWGRVFLGSSKAHKQFHSMKCLLEVGLKTPEPLRVQTFYPGVGPYEAALIYRYVEGVQEVRDAVETPLRGAIFESLAFELATMANAGVLFVDFHLRNVLVDVDGTLFWIDVEVKQGANLVRKKFWSRVERMHRECNPGVLSEGEWESFQSDVRSHLKDSEQYDPA